MEIQIKQSTGYQYDKREISAGMKLAYDLEISGKTLVQFPSQLQIQYYTNKIIWIKRLGTKWKFGFINGFFKFWFSNKDRDIGIE